MCTSHLSTLDVPYAFTLASRFYLLSVPANPGLAYSSRVRDSCLFVRLLTSESTFLPCRSTMRVIALRLLTHQRQWPTHSDSASALHFRIGLRMTRRLKMAFS